MKMEFTYGGSKINMHSDKCFYCYIVYDIEREKYYSGVKTNMNSSNACIGITYFTSSTVVDFKNRFRNNPESFTCYVEYFLTKQEAFLAEKHFHDKHKVSTDSNFYNACNSGGSTCGSGSLLCKNAEGEIYRISVEEYKTGNHDHVCKDRMVVRLIDNNQNMNIYKKDFDPTIHKTQFADYILCLDKLTNKKRRIPKIDFENNPDRYVGHTVGMVSVIDKLTNKKVRITSDEYQNNKDKFYVDTIPKTLPVINIQNGETIHVTFYEYQNNKDKYKHPNSTRLNVFDIILRKFFIIPVDSYDKTRHIRRPIDGVIITKFEGTIYPTLESLKDMFIKNGKPYKWKSIKEIAEKENIQYIKLKDYKNGKDFEN